MNNILKTLHIISSAELGGAERFFLRLTAALQEQGWPTQVIIRSNSKIAEQLAPDISYTAIGMRSRISRWQINKAISRWQPAIVQTYLGRATELTHISSTEPVHIARLGGYYSLKRYRHAHAWIANTCQLHEYLCQHGLPAERVFHIYNFIDLPENSTAAQKQPENHDNDITLLFVGRLHPVKGLSDLLQAVAQLPPRINGKTIMLWVVGDGELSAQLKQQAYTLGIAERVIWAGWQDNLAAFYQRADLVVFPSLEAETLGNVILEAWAYQKPLLSTRHRGAQELCESGKNAWCVPCADVAALRSGIEYLLTRPELAATLATNGYNKVNRYFNRQLIVQQYQQLYLNLYQQTRHQRVSA